MNKHKIIAICLLELLPKILLPAPSQDNHENRILRRNQVGIQQVILPCTIMPETRTNIADYINFINDSSNPTDMFAAVKKACSHHKNETPMIMLNYKDHLYLVSNALSPIIVGLNGNNTFLHSAFYNFHDENIEFIALINPILWKYETKENVAQTIRELLSNGYSSSEVMEKFQLLANEKFDINDLNIVIIKWNI